MKEKEVMLSATEVCVLVGCSIYTLNYWYDFKAKNPDNELAQLLPEFESACTRGKRHWRQSDVGRILEFKSRLPHGRNGILGSVTQKYAKKKGGAKNGRGKKRKTQKNVKKD